MFCFSQISNCFIIFCNGNKCTRSCEKQTRIWVGFEPLSIEFNRFFLVVILLSAR